jgi:hypothetical protein
VSGTVSFFLSCLGSTLSRIFGFTTPIRGLGTFAFGFTLMGTYDFTLGPAPAAGVTAPCMNVAPMTKAAPAKRARFNMGIPPSQIENLVFFLGRKRRP